MRITPFLLGAAFLAVSSAPATAIDLTKIDRTITKEPAYKAKPEYCLLVFGPEAKFRAWLVIDGDTLYVDRNGNGDLTEPGEKVVWKTDLKRWTWGASTGLMACRAASCCCESFRHR
jgi:hypothetical protein